MAFTYDQLEDAAVSYLQGKIPGADISPLPDGNEWKDVTARPIIYVIYFESAFDPTTAMNRSKQRDKMSLACTIRTKARRGENGLFALISQVQKALQGLQITGTDLEKVELSAVKNLVRDGEAGEWTCDVILTTSRYQMQALDDSEASVALLNSVNFNPTVQL